MADFERYTPGPCIARPSGHGWAVYAAGINDVLLGLASVTGGLPAEANARLWAAAPDLLRQRDALRRAAQRVLNEQDAFTLSTDHPRWQGALDALNELTTALAACKKGDRE